MAPTHLAASRWFAHAICERRDDAKPLASQSLQSHLLQSQQYIGVWTLFLRFSGVVGDRAAEVDISITPRQGNDQALRARACILRESRMRDFQVRIPQTKKA